VSLEPDAVIQRSDRVVDALVCGFGLWTVCAHAAVYLGAGLDALMIGFASTAVAVAAVVVLVNRPDALDEPDPNEPPR
jgi:hypothetical protein